MPKLLTPPDYSHKMALGLASGVSQAILYLAPAQEAGSDINLCPGHSPECFANCLIWSGQMIMLHAHAARVRKTRLLVEDPETFGRMLQKDLDAHLRKSVRWGMHPAIRFNGTSDFPWETWVVPHLGETIHQYLSRLSPEAMINEYTKRYGVMKRYLDGAYTPNLYMTFSLHERNQLQALDILHRGGNVTAVFRVKHDAPLPSTWMGRPVMDGDIDDLRWMDRGRAQAAGLDTTRGLVIGLRAKGRLTRSDSPFAIDPTVTSLPLMKAA